MNDILDEELVVINQRAFCFQVFVVTCMFMFIFD